ncbi:MAG: peptidylprolyl isomerase, partial [Leadbetterella sp.]|nr:peptidylprolyl isomerase [Leadbetterella sp.]
REVIQRKLFTAEARALGMDTAENFREQIASHLQLAVSAVLEDDPEIRRLGNEAYDRYLKEVNASHIFIPLSPYASAADSPKLYGELMNIRNLAIRNNDFETQAKRWSKDPKTASNGGSLGWFSVFYLVYPLENAVYSLPKDSVSLPVRTSAGYHIIRVNDTRKNSGTVQVQHIFRHIPKDMPAAEVNKLYNQLDSLRGEIEKGAKFEEFVQQFSDDFNSRPNNGILTPFGVGKTEASFEEAVFALKKGEVSRPIQSSTGLHLVRLLEKFKPLAKEEFIRQNESKLTTDSRAEYLLNRQIATFRKNNRVEIREDVLANALRFSSVRILSRNWQKPSTVILNDVLVTLNDSALTVGDFYAFVEERQEFEKWPGENPSEIFNMLFDKFLNAEIVRYREQEALRQSPDLQRWLKAQEENILYTEFLNRYVIEKSLQDTLSQKRFYEKNKNLFTPKETGTLSVMSYASEEVYAQFKELAAGKKPYKLYRGIVPVLYPQNAYVLTEQDMRKLQGLIEIMDKNPGYIVEIGGHADAKEEESVSELRIKDVVNYLVKNGLPLKRISEVNYRSSVIHDRFDWSKNQAVTFSFYSNLESDLAVTFNSKNPDAITFDTFKITRGDFETVMKTSWGNKSGTIRLDGRVEDYTLKTRKINGTYKDYKTTSFKNTRNS